MDVFNDRDDNGFIAECLASLSWAIRLALENPYWEGNDLLGAAIILNRLLESFAKRLKNQEPAGIDPALEDTTD